MKRPNTIVNKINDDVFGKREMQKVETTFESLFIF